MPGLAGIDTRALTLRIRDAGAPNGVLSFPAGRRFDIAALTAAARAWPGLEGMDLARQVSCTQSYAWDETRWAWPAGFGRQTDAKHHVVAVDYGAKRNILRCLASAGCRVTVVPATASGRRFADELGSLNQRVAALCDRVVLVVAGQPVSIKPSVT